MLRKEDLKILSYLLDELKNLDENSELKIESLPDWHKEKFNINSGSEGKLELEREFQRLLSIFKKYDVGRYFDTKRVKGYVYMKPIPQTFNVDFNKLYEQQIKEEQKRDTDLEAQETNIELNKWLLKTKWLPHIVAVISIALSTFTFFYNQNEYENEINELKERIENIESTASKDVQP